MAHLHCCARLAYARSAPDETRRHASKVVVNNHPAREMTRLRRVGTRREKQKQKAQRFGRREGKGMCTARSESPSFSSELRSVDLARTPTPVRRIAFRGASSPCPDSSSPRSPPPSLFTSASARSSAQFSVYPPALIPLLPRPVTHIHTRPPQTTPTAMTPAARAPRHPSHRMPSSTHSPHCSSLLPPGRAPLPAFAPPAPSSASSCAPPTRAANRLRRRTRFPGSVKPRVASSSCSRPARAPLLLASLLLRRARTDSQYTPPSPPRVSTPAHLHARQPHDVPPSRSTRPSSRATHAARTRHGPRKLPMTILVIAKKASPARTHHTSPPPPFPPQQAQFYQNRQLADLKKKAARVPYTSGDSPPSPSSPDGACPAAGPRPRHDRDALQESAACTHIPGSTSISTFPPPPGLDPTPTPTLAPAPARGRRHGQLNSEVGSRANGALRCADRPSKGIHLGLRSHLAPHPYPYPAPTALGKERRASKQGRAPAAYRSPRVPCSSLAERSIDARRPIPQPLPARAALSQQRTRGMSKGGGTGDDYSPRWWREGCVARGACRSMRWVRGGPASWRWGAGLGSTWGALEASKGDAGEFGWIGGGGVEEARLSARRRQGLQAEGEVRRDIHGKESGGAPTSASDIGWRTVLRSIWMSVAQRRSVSHITRMGTNVGRLRLRLHLSAIRDSEEKAGTSPQASGLINAGTPMNPASSRLAPSDSSTGELARRGNAEWAALQLIVFTLVVQLGAGINEKRKRKPGMHGPIIRQLGPSGDAGHTVSLNPMEFGGPATRRRVVCLSLELDRNSETAEFPEFIPKVNIGMKQGTRERAPCLAAKRNNGAH
ncbi:hypothetical protein DFH09DRAFT_1288193 [Mycena vulgaris]|nr:hypothetical protein DFH09DRAFT_1288193 [Mycena vulgaris]